MKLYLTMTKGLPASGKSTWAKEEVAKSEGKIKRINKDDLRMMLDADTWSKEKERLLIDVRNELTKKFLKLGLSVIIDDTNLAVIHENVLREIARSFDAEFIIKDFTDVPISVCIERDAKRGDKSVGKKVITNMYYQYLDASKLWSKPTHMLTTGMEATTNVILCDLDGTLAIHDNRNPYDLTKISTDLFNYRLWKVISLCSPNIIFVSGREGTIQCRKDTYTWLQNYTKLNDINLLMREEEDNREDSIVKKEIYEKHIKPYYEVVAVFDDRDRVVDMWRSLGLFVCQVNYGSF